MEAVMSLVTHIGLPSYCHVTSALITLFMAFSSLFCFILVCLFVPLEFEQASEASIPASFFQEQYSRIRCIY